MSEAMTLQEALVAAQQEMVNPKRSKTAKVKGKTKDGELIKDKDFDIRQCTGEKLVKQTEKAKEVSRKERPSPAGMPARRQP